MSASLPPNGGCPAAPGWPSEIFTTTDLPAIFLCSLDGHNALYRNLGGMKFKDVTAGSGIVCGNRVCRGAVFADINGDGWLDLLVSTTGFGRAVFHEQGGRDVCGLQRIRRDAQPIRRDDDGAGGH
jgi:hypothetical protein